MSEIKTRLWQRKAIEVYDTLVCDISFDHISVGMGLDEKQEPVLYHIQELGYDLCPKCKTIAPIINFDVKRPKSLVKMCDCGYESNVNRPDLYRAFTQPQ
jgi:hypothetical protein